MYDEIDAIQNSHAEFISYILDPQTKIFREVSFMRMNYQMQDK